MGQSIEVKSIVLGDVAHFDTDRSVTGQDGLGFGSEEIARAGTTTAARLAAELFSQDPAIDHVFAISNQVTVRRDTGWTDENISRSGGVISDFFIHYEENRGGPGIDG